MKKALCSCPKTIGTPTDAGRPVRRPLAPSSVYWRRLSLASIAAIGLGLFACEGGSSKKPVQSPSDSAKPVASSVGRAAPTSATTAELAASLGAVEACLKQPAGFRVRTASEANLPEAREHMASTTDPRLRPHDVLLKSWNFPLGRSETEKDAAGNGLPYVADFIVRLDALGPARTRVTVETVMSKVEVGERGTFALHSGSEKQYRDVPASMADERRLIARLSECLKL